MPSMLSVPWINRDVAFIYVFLNVIFPFFMWHEDEIAMRIVDTTKERQIKGS